MSTSTFDLSCISPSSAAKALADEAVRLDKAPGKQTLDRVKHDLDHLDGEMCERYSFRGSVQMEQKALGELSKKISETILHHDQLVQTREFYNEGSKQPGQYAPGVNGNPAAVPPFSPASIRKWVLATYSDGFSVETTLDREITKQFDLITSQKREFERKSDQLKKLLDSAPLLDRDQDNLQQQLRINAEQHDRLEQYEKELAEARKQLQDCEHQLKDTTDNLADTSIELQNEKEDKERQSKLIAMLRAQQGPEASAEAAQSTTNHISDGNNDNTDAKQPQQLVGTPQTTQTAGDADLTLDPNVSTHQAYLKKELAETKTKLSAANELKTALEKKFALVSTLVTNARETAYAKNDYKTVLHLSKHALKFGDADGAYYMGTLLYREKIAHSNASASDEKKLNLTKYDNAFSFWKSAADMGHAKAQLELGNLYFDGHLGTPDKPAALAAWTAAAEKGLANAQYRLGSAFFKGEVGEINFTQAFHWLSKAADQNHAEAKLMLETPELNVLRTPAK